jgi:hypothetical protein
VRQPVVHDLHGDVRQDGRISLRVPIRRQNAFQRMPNHNRSKLFLIFDFDHFSQLKWSIVLQIIAQKESYGSMTVTQTELFPR